MSCPLVLVASCRTRSTGYDFEPLRPTRPFGGNGQLSCQPGSNIQKALAHQRVRLLNQDRHSLVATFAQGWGNRDFSQVRNVKPLRGAGRAAARENLVALATPITDKEA